MWRTIILAFGLLFLPACGDELGITTPETPQITIGEWQGGSRIGFVEMVLAEDEGGRITGAGLIRRTGGQQAFEVTGANAFPEVALTLKFGTEAVADTLIRAQFVSYKAEFDENDGEIRLVGRLSGGRLNNLPLVLERDD